MSDNSPDSADQSSVKSSVDAFPADPSAKPDALKRTPLYDLHVAQGAKLVPFAGYEMPVQYPLGVMREHLWTREKAGLFDVSHMGQCLLSGPCGVAAAIEQLVPADISSLSDGQMRYSQLLNASGGILDDLMISRIGEKDGREWFFLVVNGACKDADFKHISAYLDEAVSLLILDDQALLALQGPGAVKALSHLVPGVETMSFMSIQQFADTDYGPLWISRSGYTGEDGFEISLASAKATPLAKALLDFDDVAMIGLGARDSLRLEAGLCLYGHDIDDQTSPIEAGLTWSIQKSRRVPDAFPGSARILAEIQNKPKRRRVGITPKGRAPAREGTIIQNSDGEAIGVITSGGFGPSVNGPVAMGYVSITHAKVGTPLQLIIRGKAMPASVSKLPFVPHRYHR